MSTTELILAGYLQELPTWAPLVAAWLAYALLGIFGLRGIRRVRLFSS